MQRSHISSRGEKGTFSPLFDCLTEGVVSSSCLRSLLTEERHMMLLKNDVLGTLKQHSVTNKYISWLKTILEPFVWSTDEEEY